MRKAKLVVTFDQAPSYDVRIGAGALNQLGVMLQQASAGEQTASRVLLLTDATSGEAVIAVAKNSLAEAGYKALTVNVCPDDALETAGELWAAMAQAKLDATHMVIALGDAPLLNLAGFVATAFDGGLPCVYVPTTLFAACQVVSDQAVFMVKGTKEQVRADIHPLCACVDLDLFATLSPQQWLEGFQLFAQAALLDSDDFFFWLSDNAGALRNRNQEAVCEALVRTLSFRSKLSATAESQGVQVWDCLRYGTEYAAATGASLADGMRFSALLSQFKAMIAEDVVQAQDGLLTQLGLLQQGSVADAHAAARAFDGAGGCVSLMLPTDIGACQQVLVPSEEVISCLEVF